MAITINELRKALNKKELPFKERTLLFTIPDNFWQRDWPWKINFVLQKMIAIDEERKRRQKK